MKLIFLSISEQRKISSCGRGRLGIEVAQVLSNCKRDSFDRSALMYSLVYGLCLCYLLMLYGTFSLL